MRWFAACLALFLSACSSEDLPTCRSSSQCDLHTGGQCISAPSGKQWCRYPDDACASGFRWSEIAGDGLGGQCVGTPDASVDALPFDARTFDAPPPLVPRLTADRESYDFGGVVQNATSPLTLTITNDGTAPSGPLSIAVSDDTTGSFVRVSAGTTDCLGLNLVPTGTCSVLIDFSPTTLGPLSAKVTVSGSGTSVQVDLGGMGLASGALTLAPDARSFPDTMIGATTSELSFTVRNTGGVSTGAIMISLTDTVSYLISSNTCPSALAGGAMCTVGVQFRPQTVGLKSASLQVMSASAGSTSAGLSGTGTAVLTIEKTGCDALGCGRVTSTVPGIDCGGDCNEAFSTQMVTLNAVPDSCPAVTPATPCWSFAGWSGGGCSGTGACAVTMDAAKTVTAGFTRTKYTMRFELNNGDGRSDIGVGRVYLWMPSVGLVCGPAMTLFLACTVALPVGTGRVQIKGCTTPGSSTTMGFNRLQPPDPGHTACVNGNPFEYSNCPTTAEVGCDFTLQADTTVGAYFQFP